MSRIAILKPELVYSAGHEGYSFPSWSGERLYWPREGGAHLGQCGAYNFFLRAGLKPSIVGLDELARLGPEDILVVDLPSSGPADASLLSKLVSLPCPLMITGDLAQGAAALNINPPIPVKPSSPYNTIGVTVDDRTTPIQPSDWGAFTFPDSAAFDLSHPLFEISGDRFSPATALRIPIPNAFLLAKTRSAVPRYLLNATPFAALQSWLQGQDDLVHWQGWNSRQHWLDDFVDLLFDVIRPLVVGRSFEMIDLPPSTICLRHDNDDSVDSIFAQIEETEGVESTYALLHDDNLPEWQKIRRRHSSHEYAFHYTTIAPRYNLSKYSKLALSLTPLRSIAAEYCVGRHVLGGDRLIKQVKLAKAAGIDVATLHRHFAYLPYPEIIDAFHGVYASSLGVLATSSFFRGNLYRWGMEELDGSLSSNAPWPDVQFPYWLPFRIAHAGRRGEILPGWECTMMMEPEPEFVEQVATKRHRNLPHKFTMLCYHPSNAKKSPLVKGGTLPWLKETIYIGRRQNYVFSRYDRFIAMLNTAVNGHDRL